MSASMSAGGGALIGEGRSSGGAGASGSVKKKSDLEMASDLLWDSVARDQGPENVDLAHLLKNPRQSAAHNYYVKSYHKNRIARVSAGSSRWLEPLQSASCRTVPRAIQNLYAEVECEMFMGLFPEISRAWITIDNRLFLWNYYKGEEFYMYDDLDQLIVSVGLARPKPGLFDEDVEYLLILATPVEIVLLQVKILGHPILGEIELYPTEFNLPSDNVPMRSIAGTRDGRIFMAGHDGSLYEFIYERPNMLHSLGIKRQCRKVELSGMAPVKWLVPNFIRELAGVSDPLVKVLIDHNRGLMYTLSDRSAITLYKLSSTTKLAASITQPPPSVATSFDGDSTNQAQTSTDAPKLVQRISDVTTLARRLVQNPSHRSATSGLYPQNLNEPLQIVSLSIVHETESKTVHLVAVTHRGIRLYFTTSIGNRIGAQLELYHIRGPPNKESLHQALFSPESQQQQQQQLLVHQSSRFASSPFTPNQIMPQGQQQQQTYFGAASGLNVDSGIEPGSSTESIVTCAAYESGVTLLAFQSSNELNIAPPRIGGDTGTKNTLMGFSTDLSMRTTPPDSRLSPAFPPLRWQLESFHEMVDYGIIKRGPMLHEAMIHGNPTTEAIRAAQNLPVGRIWDMIEETLDPSLDQEQLAVYAHMFQEPFVSTGSTPSSSSTLQGSSIGRNGNGKRPYIASETTGTSVIDPGSVGTKSQPAILTELATQHLLPRRSFLVLSSTGLWCLTKNRPVNQLYALLQGPDPGTNADIEEFLRLYGLDEGCAMCLAIACSGVVTSEDTVEQRQQPENDSPNNTLFDAFNNGTSTGSTGAASISGKTQDDRVARRALSWFQRMGYGLNVGASDGRSGKSELLPAFEQTLSSSGIQPQHARSSQVPPAMSQQSHHPTAVALMAPGQSGNIIHSGCYMGLCLHLTRLLRPIWDWTVMIQDTNVERIGPGRPSLRCRWSSKQIAMIVQPLEQLRYFMKNRPPYRDVILQGLRNLEEKQYPQANESSLVLQSMGTGTPFSNRTRTNRVGLPKPNALVIENEKVFKIYQLVNHTVQALHLFDTLQMNELPLSRLISSIRDPEVEGKLLVMTWNELIATLQGKVVASSLVKALVEISPGSSSFQVKALVERLRSVSPSFFSQGDALELVALDELASARALQGAQRNAVLDAALDKLRRGFEQTHTIEVAEYPLARRGLEDACEIFKSLGAFAHAAELALHSAGCYAIEPLGSNPSVPMKATKSSPSASWASLRPIIISSPPASMETAPPASGVGFAASSGGMIASRSLGTEKEKGNSLFELERSLHLRASCYEIVRDLLDECGPVEPGGKPQNPVGFNDAMSVALKSPDRLWHGNLYLWLISRGFKDLLLSIDSPFIEEFLRNPSENDPTFAAPGIYVLPNGDPHADMHLLLLKDWLAKHGRHAEASVVMRQLATLEANTNNTNTNIEEGYSNGYGAIAAVADRNNANVGRDHQVSGETGDGQKQRRNPCLEQRIEYFSRALTQAKAAEPDGNFVQAQRKTLQDVGLDLSQLQDEFDVAKLQLSVFQALSDDTNRRRNSKLDDLQERLQALDKLWWTLVHPTTLYNEYAYRFSLWKECIKIMQVCEYDDRQELQTLYRNIILEEMNYFSDQDFLHDNRWTDHLKNRIVELGRSFYDEGGAHSFAFPFDFLIMELEDIYAIIQQRVLEHTQSHQNLQWNPWVLSAMQEIGIPYADLFIAYCNYEEHIQSGANLSGGRTLGLDDVEGYDERSKLYVARAIWKLVSEWIAQVRAGVASHSDTKALHRQTFQPGSSGIAGSESSLRDRIDRLSVIVGGLHGDNVSNQERTSLTNDLTKLASELDRLEP